MRSCLLCVLPVLAACGVERSERQAVVHSQLQRLGLETEIRVAGPYCEQACPAADCDPEVALAAACASVETDEPQGGWWCLPINGGEGACFVDDVDSPSCSWGYFVACDCYFVHKVPIEPFELEWQR